PFRFHNDETVPGNLWITLKAPEKHARIIARGVRSGGAFDAGKKSHDDRRGYLAPTPGQWWDIGCRASERQSRPRVHGTGEEFQRTGRGGSQRPARWPAGPPGLT